MKKPAKGGRRSQCLTRRVFLHRCALCTGAAILPPAWALMADSTNLYAASHQHGHPTDAVTGRGPIAFRYFTTDDAATVEALSEQIIPADKDPGAKWAGVVHYIDLGLAGKFKEQRPIYESGLKRLATLAREVAPQPFALLDFATQTRVLEKFEADSVSDASGRSGREFFLLVRQQTIEGFFGDPKYGGNRDSIGWKILKFEG
ncbi:MAG: gluconate 2-dehydrogenase subunit 3 family protein [Terriglobia bacterium]